jgi:formate dehydrogenase subunit gamma
MSTLIRHLIASAALALAAGTCAAQATAPAAADAPKGPPAGFVAPAEPKPDEGNAQRAKSQPGNNAPFWRAVRESGHNAGVTNLPGAEQGVLIQPFVQYPGSRFTNAGEAWRQVRNQWIIPYGGSLLLIVALGIALFYWRKGPLGGEHADTGRVVERFTPFERAAHWTNAIAFVVLAISGVVMAFGKFFLLPVLGGTLFGGLTYLLKNAHNFAGPLFAVSLVIVFVTFVKDNLPSKVDLVWLAKGGGLLFGHEQLPSGRFNAAEKIIFWAGVFALGVVVVASGLVLDKLVPGLEYLRGDMQIAHLVHACAALLMLAMFMGHIYLGTVGTKGAYQGMRTGWVDESWAREHHGLWLDDIHAGRIPAQRSKAAGPGAVGTTAQQA